MFDFCAPPEGHKYGVFILSPINLRGTFLKNGVPHGPETFADIVNFFVVIHLLTLKWFVMSRESISSEVHAFESETGYEIEYPFQC